MAEEEWSSTALLENTRSISRGLEALKTEHEAQLSEIKMNTEEEGGGRL